MPDAVDRVGLGVDLAGGADTLSQLRAIREEMSQVARLAGRGSNNTDSARDTIREIERYELDSIRNVERARIESVRRVARAQSEADVPITRQEVNAGASASNRRARLKSEIALRNEQEKRDTEQFIQDRRARIKALQSDPALRESEVLGQQGRLFQRYRNDPARDDQTNKFRSQIAAEIQARRNVVKEERVIEDERRAVQARKIASMERENAEQFRLIRRNIQNELQATQERRALAAQQAQQPFTDLENALGRSQSDVYGTLYSRRGRRAAGGVLAASAGGGAEVGPNGEPIRTVNGQRGYFGTNKKGIPTFTPYDESPGPGGPKPPKGGGGGEDDEEESGGGGRKGSGILGTAGRIARNLVIYEILTRMTTGLLHYAEASIAAAKATTEQGNALKYATEQGHGNLEANRALSDSLQKYGYNNIQSQQVVAQAARATYRNPNLTGPLAQLATDIAASRGGGIAQAPKVIEDIQEGRDRTYREYFNITPEDLYKQEARRVISQRTSNTDVRTVYGTNSADYKTSEQEVSKYVSSLSEADKETIRLNFAVSQQARFAGDAEARSQTLAGKLDLASAAFANLSATVGFFITDFKPLGEIIEVIGADAKLLSSGSAGQITQSGPGSTITQLDIARYQASRAASPRQDALDSISSFFPSFTGPLRGTEKGGYGSVALGAIGGVGNILSSFLGLAPVTNALLGGGTLAIETRANVAANEGYRLRAQQIATARANGTWDEAKQDFKPAYDPAGKAYIDQLEQRERLRTAVTTDTSGKRNKLGQLLTQDALYAFDAKNNAALLDSFQPSDYRGDALKREDERRQKEQREKEKDLQERDNALRKLRDSAEGSFRLIGDIGESITGRDNPFTKILADQITAAERMRQQWGFLGEAAVKYFTTLEQAALNRQLNVAEYGAYTKASDLTNQAGRETDTRNDPTVLSRREQDYLNIQTAIVNRAIQIPQLWKQAAEVLRSPGLSPTAFIASELGNLASAYGVRGPRIQNALGQNITPDGRRYNSAGQDIGGAFDIPERLNAFGQSLEDPNAINAFRNVGVGKSPQLQRQLRQNFASNILSAFQGFSPQQIRGSGLSSYYRAALATQAQGLGEGVQDQIAKAQLGANEDQRLSNQLRADDRFRQEQLRKGYDVSDVGRESDKLILARTNGVNPKDLTYDQFQARQEALRRESDRSVKDQQEAKDATKQALAYQKDLLAEVTKLRAAIVGGDASVLIQVQNDTQARIDKQSLEQSEPGPLKNLNLDQRGVKSSPFTPSTERYHREGGSYGLTNR